jgi:ketosteroid isomerase-like protein
MTTTTDTTTRTAHLLELMKKGDDAFNAHDFAGMNAVHHPDMVAHITGNPTPLHGRVAHAAAMEQFFHMFPTSTSRTTHTRSSSEAATGPP